MTNSSAGRMLPLGGLMFRVSTIVLAAIGVVGCSTPMAPVTMTTPATLSAGNYTLRLEPRNVAGAGSFCGISGPAAPDTSLAIPVVVVREGTAWSARPAGSADRGLVVTLTQTASAFTGTATGDAFDGTKVASFGSTEAPARAVELIGPPLSTDSISGYTSGEIGFTSTGGTSFCSSFSWVLVAR